MILDGFGGYVWFDVGLLVYGVLVWVVWWVILWLYCWFWVDFGWVVGAGTLWSVCGCVVLLVIDCGQVWCLLVAWVLGFWFGRYVLCF